MTKTEYLFGHTKEKYHGVEFPQIGYDRIKDGRELISELYLGISYDPLFQDQEQINLSTRIRKVSEAIEVWKKIVSEDG